MGNHVHDHQVTDQSWTNYAASSTPSPVGPQDPNDHAGHERGHSGHGAHMWMMLVMCLPLVLFGIWSLASGRGSSALLGGLICMGMMAFMHLGMGGHGGHNH